MKIPSVYVKAAWRNTTEVDIAEQLIGVGFTCEDCEIVRLTIGVADAWRVVESLRAAMTRT